RGGMAAPRFLSAACAITSWIAQRRNRASVVALLGRITSALSDAQHGPVGTISFPSVPTRPVMRIFPSKRAESVKPDGPPPPITGIWQSAVASLTTRNGLFPLVITATFESAVWAHSPAIPKLLQVGFDRRIQPRRFLLLFTPLGTESLHLFFKWLAIIFLFRRAHIAAGGEHMAVLADLVQRGRLAEAGHVGVFARVLLASPSMVGSGDLLDVGL